MHIWIAADHRGYELKNALLGRIRDAGYEVDDLSSHTLTPGDDYPPLAYAVCDRVAVDGAARGVLLCGTGNGMVMAANRNHDIRAALAWNPDIARKARNDEDANVLVLPAESLTHDQAADVLFRFLETPFSEDERHRQRIAAL